MLRFALLSFTKQTVPGGMSNGPLASGFAVGPVKSVLNRSGWPV